MLNSISNDFIIQLKKDYDEIKDFLLKHNYNLLDLPIKRNAIKDSGEAFALAYPIQGILKYHGFINPQDQIPYIPSISFCNDSFFTVSYLKFDKSLNKDIAILNGNQVFGDILNRITRSLNNIRKFSAIHTKAILISRNLLKSGDLNYIGKGLGTSASGSAALSLAATSIIYNNSQEYLSNYSLISFFSRYLSGSGCRSATGGISLWLSHPEIDSYDSYAVRLDRKEHKKFIENISLITVPIKSELKTSQAHESAPMSPFFLSWLKIRKKIILDFFKALVHNDFTKLGEIAEFDTLCLHSVAMTSQKDQIIAWAPESIKIMHKVKELREHKGYNVYFSIDTGPSVVLLTTEREKEEIVNEMKKILPKNFLSVGKIGGPSELLNPKSPEAKKLENDINKFMNY